MSEFSIEKKGYSISEVDDAIENLAAKNSFLEEQNRSLTERLSDAEERIDEYRAAENSLRQSIADSKRAAAAMIAEAKSRSEKLLDDARDGCGKIIKELDAEIAQKMRTLDVIKANVDEFKSKLFELYSDHIEMIDTISNTAESFKYDPDYSPVSDAVDSFEQGGEPQCDEPEFADYPDGSLFPEETENDSFEITEEAEPEEPEEPEEFDEPDQSDESGKSDGEQVGAEDDKNDYFKFLSDFAESEDEISGSTDGESNL